MAIIALAKEIEQLFSQPDADPASLSVPLQNLMKEYAKTETDYESYIHWNDIHYTRNLVYHNDQFELMVICWKAGQASRIHSHTNSDCWMAILEGEVEETRYMPKSEGLIKDLVYPGPCPELEETHHVVCGKGEINHINDDIGLHRVRAGEGTHGITLHLYSPPIKEARILEPESGSTTKRTPGFYSVYPSILRCPKEEEGDERENFLYLFNKKKRRKRKQREEIY